MSKIDNNFEFVDIEVCECIGYFEDEYVYDIEMDDETHTFIANDILVHNSNYLVINHILNSIKGVETWTDIQKAQFCVDLSEKYLNNLFNTTLYDYFKERNVDSVHNFELETVAKTGIWIDVKKRYAQSILWKDGRMYDTPQIKIKGLEIVRSSSPTYSRKILKEMMGVLLLEDDSDFNLVNKLNNISQRALMNAPDQYIDDLCENMSVNNYAKYVVNDKEGLYPQTVKGTPFNVNATALYNWIVNKNKYQDENIYGGKIKIYIINDHKKRKPTTSDRYFAFMAEAYPKWGMKEAPINYTAMHEKTILNPINRILEAINMNMLRADGSLTISLF